MNKEATKTLNIFFKSKVNNLYISRFLYSKLSMEKKLNSKSYIQIPKILKYQKHYYSPK